MKKIVNIKAVNAGSPPDVDSDFNTTIRSKVFQHVAEVHGENNISSIVTFNSLAAKGAFKEMCTIYEVPFSQANKITELVPPPVDGKDCKFRDIFNPESDRYNEAQDFRNATNGEEWEKIIDGSLAIEGRYKSTGIHPCGLIISSKDLRNVVPLKKVNDKGNQRVVSQWTYPELESLGLIKFDFLNLDTVDLVQHTVERIVKAGKTPPNMVQLVHGEMNDKKTYEMIAKGETVGVFQLGSQIVQDFMFVMKPTCFDDIAASTAMLRPGPMAMNTHTKYANRKNGIEKIEPLHPDFKNSPLTEILEDTYSLIIYQEQVMKIANQIANFTLKEADKLRSAMGKKKVDVMNAMKGKFYEGAEKNGYSKEAIDILWDTIFEFSKYAFNKSHSVAYAMAAYQTAYLKAHYPVEFMSALISQKKDKKDKVLEYLHEARRMGLKIGSTNINLSDVEVSPNFKRIGEHDIIYGLSAVKAISTETAEIIIREREENGTYDSVQNLLDRCVPLGLNNKKVYENLTLSGAFDTFEVPRKAVIDNLDGMLKAAKTKNSRGMSLFDFDDSDDGSESEIDLNATKEYDFVERIKNEADVIGLYLTEHPLSRMGKLPEGTTKLSTVLNSTKPMKAKVAGSVSSLEMKTRKTGGRSIIINIDDGEDFIKANVDRTLIKGIDRLNAIRKIETAFLKGNSVSEEVINVALNDDSQPIEDIEENAIYTFEIMFRPAYKNNGNYTAKIVKIEPLKLSYNGILPIRVRIKDESGKKKKVYLSNFKKYATKLSEKYPGEYPIVVSVYNNRTERILDKASIYVEKLIKEMQKTLGETKEQLPKFSYSPSEYRKMSDEELSQKLRYVETGLTTEKDISVEEKLCSSFGMDRIDFGIFNQPER